MKYTLQNAKIFAEIDSHGAELVDLKYDWEQILYKKHPDFWQRQSPILFPIVGWLKEKKYQYNGQEFSLSQHGFARDMEFELIKKEENILEFLLHSNAETLVNYPFNWELKVAYILEEKSIRVEYQVKNTSNNVMYFSIGGHPAFQIRSNIEQYYLKFDQNMINNPIDRIHPTEFLLDENFQEVFPKSKRGENILELDEKYFSVDAMIFRNLESKKIDFYENENKMFTFIFEGFPHLGIWKQPNSPFICLEPWDGYVDMIDANGKIEEKAGIQKLEKWESRKYAWSVIF